MCVRVFMRKSFVCVCVHVCAKECMHVYLTKPGFSAARDLFPKVGVRGSVADSDT